MNKIELKSKNTRRIIGPIPNKLFISGVIIMLIITIALALTLFYLPYPLNENEKIIMLIIKFLNL